MEICRRATRTIQFAILAEQLPTPENRVAIDWNDRDSGGQPRLQISYKVGDYTRAGLRRGIDLVNRIGQMLGSESPHVTFDGHSHLMGTLRMGLDPATSVVDQVGRAHDHPNLFVAGSAVFPTSSAASPTLTIAALALRTADAVAEQVT